MTNPKPNPVSHDNETVIFSNRKGDPVTEASKADMIEVTQVDSEGKPVQSTLMVRRDREPPATNPFAPV